MNGSQKQIAWAEKIHAAALPKITEIAVLWADESRFDEKFRIAASAVISCESAAWWIDQRAIEHSPASVMRDVVNKITIATHRAKLNNTTLRDEFNAIGYGLTI